jgi:hypothetical protein
MQSPVRGRLGALTVCAPPPAVVHHCTHAGLKCRDLFLRLRLRLADYAQRRRKGGSVLCVKPPLFPALVRYIWNGWKDREKPAVGALMVLFGAAVFVA